jgi:soluble epoxide hydrolase / lipid-phosphate phosphatase
MSIEVVPFSMSRRGFLSLSGLALGASIGLHGEAAVAALAMPPVKFVRTNGIRMAVYDAGKGPAVVLLHGWPELAYSWRNQIPALVSAGYRVVVPDQRGYGLTDRPPEVEAYDMVHLTGDLVGLLDALGIQKAIFCGHDWGGLVVWQMPLFHRDRVAGVIGLNSPFVPRLPLPPIETLRFIFGERMYVVSFQDYGVDDALLEKDVERVFRTLMRKKVIRAAEYFALPPEHRHFDFIRQFEAPEPKRLPGEPVLDRDELQVFVTAYKATGFTGGINWYRNVQRNWEASRGIEQRVSVPSLMLSAEDDVVLPPALTDGMETYVPDLEKHTISDCGHWAQQEKPNEVNRIIIDWLKRRFPA